MADWGVKIVRDGAGIESTDDRDLVLSSKYKTPKTLELASTSIAVTAGPPYLTTKLIAHGLGYQPMFLAYAEVNSGQWVDITMSKVVILSGYPGYGIFFRVSSDATNITILAYTIAPIVGTLTINIKYFTIIDEKI